MLRTKYYEANRIKKAVEKMIADGAENLEGSSFKAYLPHKDQDQVEYYSAILEEVKRFLERFKCSIDAVGFFEGYMEIRDDIIKAMEDPENASASSSILASSEFGELIVKHKTPFDIVKWELDSEQEDYDKKRINTLYHGDQCPQYYPSMPPIPNSYSPAGYNPYQKYGVMGDHYAHWSEPFKGYDD